ncbi:MAG: hypothetical protein JWM16_4395, partial [Verrucomicrobiales bacterium]|nr:hypothetical protein [Verrucomicrobiales bacterium]
MSNARGTYLKVLAVLFSIWWVVTAI